MMLFVGMPSIPDKFRIYHGEQMFVTGPGGVQANRTSECLTKELLEPQFMPFQQVRRWIMEMFELDEAKHELVLQYIVSVKNKPSMHPYSMLVDIVGLDSWKTFLNVKWRTGDSFVLYVHWHAKEEPAAGPLADGATSSNNGAAAAAAPAATVAQPAPAAVATAADVEAAAVTDEHEHGGGWPTCKHGKPCTVETSWGRHDPGRRFYRCPLFADPSKDCGFTQWLDSKFPENATKHMNCLLDSVETLEQQVANLQEELDEVRRRYLNKSAESASSNISDSEPRPRQIRRLARDN
ncbi:hypothetical protein ACP70R_024196 [Stipagrostis hirtigluma subsp. patula]